MRLTILIFILGFSYFNVAAAPVYYDFSELENVVEEGLSGQGYASLSAIVSGNSQLPAIPLPSHPEIQSVEGLFPGEGVTVEQILERSEKRGLPVNIDELITEQFGEPLKEGRDKEKIKAALEMLGKSKYGAMMCKSVAYTCDLESIKKAGIEIRIKDAFSGDAANALALVANPVHVAGRYVLSIPRVSLLGDGALDIDPYSIKEIASIVTHELSHIEDLKDNKVNTLSKFKFASEVKASFAEYAAYASMSDGTNQNLGAGLGYSFFADVWKWKKENGRIPYGHGRDFDAILNMPANTFEDVLGNYVKHVNPNLKTSPATDAKEMWNLICVKLADRMEDYRLWRISNHLYTPPQPVPQPVQPPPNPHPIPVQPPQPVQPPVTPPTPQPKPVLSVSENSLTFHGQEDQYSPSSERIGIRNSGGGVLNWVISSDVSWLSFKPASGSSTGETDYVSVDVDDSRMNAGTYWAVITVSAGSLTKTVQVRVIIEPYLIDIDVSDR